MLHLSEAFFVHELPWKSLLNVTDSRSVLYHNLSIIISLFKYHSKIIAGYSTTQCKCLSTFKAPFWYKKDKNQY